MARPLRIQFPGALYHVTNRGNERKPIFKSDADRAAFLKLLSKSLATYGTRLFSFVLMANHFHLLVETPLGNCSEFMRHFNITYTSYFNRQHRRVGHLYQGRYKSVLVDRDEYLSMAARYIHLNPVKVGTIKRQPLDKQLECLWGYRWSSLPGVIDSGARYDFVEYGVLLEEYGGDSKSGRNRYRAQIAADLAAGLPLKEKVVGQSLLGGEAFVARVRKEYLGDDRDRERPAVAEVRRFVNREGILRAVKEASGLGEEEMLKRAGTLRQVTMDVLYRLGGLTNLEIGRLMGVDYSTVSQGRKRLRAKLAEDEALRRLVAKIEKSAAG